MTLPANHSLRPARAGDRDSLAHLWHAGWHEAHAALVPADLIAARTLESFHQRLALHLPHILLAEGEGRITGFVAVQGSELYQLYTARSARGTGVAAALLDAGEQRLSAAGVADAHLLCALGNHRAARFYEKQGWHNTGTTRDAVELVDGHFPLTVWRFEKAIAPRG